jgi:hypothetical protein
METTPEIDYVALLAALKKKREDLNTAIFGIEQLLGLPSSSGGDAVGVPTVATSASGVPRDTQIQEDTFFGMNIVSASQKYLAMRKKPASPVEIAKALAEGGLTSQSERLHNTVNAVLNRNAQSTSPIFAKVKRGTWGLRSWYPNYRPAKDDDKDEE